MRSQTTPFCSLHQGGTFIDVTAFFPLTLLPMRMPFRDGHCNEPACLHISPSHPNHRRFLFFYDKKSAFYQSNHTLRLLLRTSLTLYGVGLSLCSVS